MMRARNRGPIAPQAQRWILANRWNGMEGVTSGVSAAVRKGASRDGPP